MTVCKKRARTDRVKPGGTAGSLFFLSQQIFRFAGTGFFIFSGEDIDYVHFIKALAHAAPYHNKSF
jgi:hypothetical protein